MRSASLLIKTLLILLFNKLFHFPSAARSNRPRLVALTFAFEALALKDIIFFSEYLDRQDSKQSEQRQMEVGCYHKKTVKSKILPKS